MSPQATQIIDVTRLIAAKTVAEHNSLAEEYFSKLNDWTYHLSKPFTTFDEMPQLLVNFAVITQGLSLCPGLTVLEFGAGTCWASRWLTQMGCRVIAVDVSPTALRIGTELYACQPPFGDKPAPQFLAFDGFRLDLPDGSVERIICLDAFHYVPNPAQVLAEMYRVLAVGGIAGFAEPGPEHSRSVTSQYEMHHHGIIENDVDIHAIWDLAHRAGFADCKIAAFKQDALLLSVPEFDSFLAGGTQQYADETRHFLRDKRNFFLYKAGTPTRDSRLRTGLTAAIEPVYKFILAHTDETITVQAVVTNTGASVWLPAAAGVGAVFLGFHVRRRAGGMYHESYHWEALTPEPVLPGASITVTARLTALPPGHYTLELDMVSNEVCWFTLNGSPTPHIQVDVMA